MLQAFSGFKLSKFGKDILSHLFTSIHPIKVLCEPWVLQGILCGNALVGIFSEKLCDEIYARLSNTCILESLNGVFAPFDLSKNFCVCFTIERSHSRQHCIQDAANRPAITFLIVILLNHFWSDVV